MSAPETQPLRVAPIDSVAEVHFDEAMESRISGLLTHYPTTQAALLPVLWECQKEWAWLSTGIMRAVAGRLELSPAYVEGVASFYTMYQLEPPGKYLLQVCTTLSCQLCGAESLVEHLKDRLKIDFGQTTKDGLFTLVDVQCLGACGEGPVIQVNDDYYGHLTPGSLDEILDELEKGARR